MIGFVLLSVIIHSIFLYSVFDIYFKSPIIHGMTPYSTPVAAPADRLVLIVADGMRADKFFEISETGETNSPFLRNIITDVGAWGVSHTRVPTESRPGHVAIVGGIYEDVSAITRGWKENPVEFDSVFNESRYTWAWGSPDILPMFNKGAKNNVFIDTYDTAEEDFAAANPDKLDTWVFQKLENFLAEANTNSSLKNMLSQTKVIFFLHLLGMDVSGHSYKPGSQEYIKNIKIVDSGISHCVDLIESFFNNDGKTAYVFTSDHGMTDWGSHGSGEMHETFTPLVAWGAGIRKPMGEGKDIYHDGLSHEWKLAQVKRVDVNQVDIAPLISSLIGIPFPVNSLGILPVEYLGTDWPHRAFSLLTNARQILAHYQTLMYQKKDNMLSIFFWQFRELSSSRQAELLSMVDILLKQNRFVDAVQVGLKIIELALKGLTYYQTHDRIALGISIFLGFLGWMSYVFVLILRDYTTIKHTSLESSFLQVDEDDSHNLKCLVSYIFIGTCIAILLFVQNSPYMYYIYFLLPVMLWLLVSLQWDVIFLAKLHLEKRNFFLKFIGISVLSFIGMELLVLSFFKREVMSVILWVLSIWPLLLPEASDNKRLCISWCVLSIILSAFPMMPVVGKETDYNLVIIVGWLFVFTVGFCARRPETGLILNNRTGKREPLRVVQLTALQVVILCIATYTIQSTSQSIANKDGLPFLNQVVAWLTLVTSLILPLYGSQFILTRLMNIMMSLFALYILLSIAHEAMFCFLLCIYMMLWLVIEYQLSYNYLRLQDLRFSVTHLDPGRKKPTTEISLGDFRRAYFFIFFILLAFFGTGNIASINSFNPTSVYCFLTVFNPFFMGFLILLKILIPFLIVSCILRAINASLGTSPRALFLLILLMSDFMGMHFFFLVQDTGSWLDIGTSISHFIISITIIIFIMLLYGLAWVYTTVTCALPLKRHLL